MTNENNTSRHDGDKCNYMRTFFWKCSAKVFKQENWYTVHGILGHSNWIDIRGLKEYISQYTRNSTEFRNNYELGGDKESGSSDNNGDKCNHLLRTSDQKYNVAEFQTNHKLSLDH